jgi:hypothetical protein
VNLRRDNALRAEPGLAGHHGFARTSGLYMLDTVGNRETRIVEAWDDLGAGLVSLRIFE